MSKVHGHHHVQHTSQAQQIKAEVKAEVQKELKALLPQMKDQFQGGTVSGSNATAGANATGGASLPAPSGAGASGVGGASEANTPVTQVGGSAVDGVFSSLGNAESGLLGTLNEAMTQTPDDKGMISIGGKKVNANAYLQNLQFRLSSLHEMMNTLSNILKDENQARMNTINNLRG
jgi:hypothetical protein